MSIKQVFFGLNRPRNIVDTIGLNLPACGLIFPRWWQFAILLFIVAITFPAAIIAIIVIALMDFLLISRFLVLQKLLKWTFKLNLVSQ